MNIKPWISILIPSYEYPEGVFRILNLIELAENSDIECVIADDSESNSIELLVRSHPLYLEGKVIYIKNQPAIGAVRNWNSLLNRASGDYILLMHHDECPEHPDFFNQLRSIIQESNNLDLVFLRCSHLAFRDTRLFFYMPHLVIVFLLRFAPEFLLLHNVVGSPSNVFVRRSVCLQFDENLKWLVDVDWMVALLNQKNIQWSIARHLSVISVYNSKTSITKSLESDISKLRTEEARLIKHKLGSSVVFKLILADTFLGKISAKIENIIWLFLFGLIKITSYLRMRSVPEWWINANKK
jgi:glycosyltransferase involved in cell wall biosynthesis